MAKMHSGAKGKSGSTKPSKKTKKSWNIHSSQEVEQLIVKLAKTGEISSQIGLILRDTYGVPDVRVITGKKMNKILEEHKLLSKLPEDLLALIKKDIKLTKHLEAFKKDQSVKRGKMLTQSKINRLASYYKTKGKLPINWQYDPANAKFLLE